MTDRLELTPCLRCSRLTANRGKECTVCLNGGEVQVTILSIETAPRSGTRVRTPSLPNRTRCGGGFRVMRRNFGND